MKKMNNDIIIIITEDDDGHAFLITKNLRRAGIGNEIIHFKNGREVLDFLLQRGNGLHREDKASYLMLLDINMPEIDGIEVLRQVKQNKELRKIPTIMVTTTDDPREIEKCYELGCNVYVTKPVDYEKFIDAINRLGFFLMVAEIPKMSGDNKNAS